MNLKKIIPENAEIAEALEEMRKEKLDKDKEEAEFAEQLYADLLEIRNGEMARMEDEEIGSLEIE